VTEKNLGCAWVIPIVVGVGLNASLQKVIAQEHAEWIVSQPVLGGDDGVRQTERR
jgi:hypothetical protein